MNKHLCPACDGNNTICTHQTTRSDRLCISNHCCWRCGYAWEARNGYPIREDVRSAISYRRTDRYHRLTRGATHA